MKTSFLTLTAALAALLLAASCGEKTCTRPGETLPILAWHSIPADQLTEERFQELADAGFNINFSHLWSLNDALKSLELGQKTGVKILFTCGDLYGKTDSIVSLVKDHPALWGYFLRDEPWCKDFPDLAAWKWVGPATLDQSQEGPNVFRLGGKYWMIADVWQGLAVYESDDLTAWRRQEGDILSMRGRGRLEVAEVRGTTKKGRTVVVLKRYM